VKLGLNILMRRLDSEPALKMSVHDYLWKNSDPLLKLAAKLVPSMVPTDNVGVLDMVSHGWSLGLHAKSPTYVTYCLLAGNKTTGPVGKHILVSLANQHLRASFVF
jgi:hypothetical protein